MAVVAAGVYFFANKKQTTESAPAAQTLPAESSAEQSAASPSDTPTEATKEDGDAEHAANHLPASFGKLSDFTLTNQAGQEFTLAGVNGKVLVMNFFFTRCEGPCPLMNKKLEGLQEKFAKDADIKLVSITVDPANDTVEVLKGYSEKFKANVEKWSFLTGSKDVITDIMEKQMKLAGGDISTHSTRFALIDKDGTIKGFYDSSSEEELAKLEVEARKLATASSAS
jgi:protein SCO1/2